MSLQLILAILSKNRTPSPPLSGDQVGFRFSGTDESDLELGFRFESSTLSATGPWTIMGSIEALSGTGQTYSEDVYGFEYNTHYWLRSISYNASGDSTNYTVLERNTRPEFSPTGLSATAINYSDIVLTWNLPSELPLGGYYIEKSSAGPFEEVTTVSNTVSTYSVLGLFDNTEYNFRIYSYNNNGIDGRAIAPTPSNTSSATTEEAPPVIEDNFDRADGGLGSNWTIRMGDNMAIEDGEVVTNGVDAEDQMAVWNADVLGNDQFSRWTVRSSQHGNLYPGLIVRGNMSGNLNCYFYNSSMNGNNGIAKFVDNDYSRLGDELFTTWNNEDIMELRAVGNVVSIWKNGVMVASREDSTFASGAPGIAQNALGSEHTLKCDSWVGGEL
jgi:hypothetical protein